MKEHKHKHKFKPHYIQNPIMARIDLLIICETCGKRASEEIKYHSNTGSTMRVNIE